MAKRMRDPLFRREQWDGRYLPHLEPINQLVDAIKTDDEWVPYVAPDYGGVDARLLALFRDPGPATQHSKMLCIENPDESAARYCKFMTMAGINVKDLQAWNIYPWYINRKPTTAEIERGLIPLKLLLEFLPNLQVVMAHGGEAQKGWKLFERYYPSLARSYQVIETFHTSPQATVAHGREWTDNQLRNAFADAAELLHR
jgi:hypothetical protein